MFEAFGEGPPEDWEPIPDEVLNELAPYEAPDPAEGLAPWSTGADTLVDQALSRPLGSDTLALLEATAPLTLTESGRSLALRRLEQLSARVEALKAEMTAAIAGTTPETERDRLDDFSAHEVGVATKSSIYAADRAIRFARDLAARLQATAAAMAEGQISAPQARALSEATGHLAIDIAREIESKMLIYVHRQDLTLFRASLRRWLAKLDPEFTARATAARKECVVEHTANDDGTGDLFIRGPLEITTQISMALRAYAARTKDTLGGTAAQRKLAGLRDTIERYLASPDCPTNHRRVPGVNVVIDLATLLGLRDGMAEIPGVGAIPASAVRWLIADGAPLRRLIIDPKNGQLLEYGTDTYIAPAELADYLIAKNIHSVSPHSNVESAGADMEHNIPHQAGGRTNPINCTPVDRRWHRSKTLGHWTYRKDPETGIVIWTSSTGLTCQIDPYDYRMTA
jgi:hypothetical protein